MAVLVCLFAVPNTASAVRTVALSGQSAPDAGSGVTYSGFSEFALNDAGRTAFAATLTGAGVDASNNSGLWSEGLGSLSLVARTGSEATGASDFTYWDFLEFVGINDVGQVAFSALLADSEGETSSAGVWSEGSGSLALVARAGTQAPGLPSGVEYWGAPFGLKMNNAGQTAFNFEVFGQELAPNSDFARAIWSEGSGTLSLVALQRDLAPAAGDDEEFIDFSEPVLNNAGDTAFTASISNNKGGIWTDRSGSLLPVVISSDQPPGMPDEVDFAASFGRLGWNDAGLAVFPASFSWNFDTVDPTNDHSIWTDRSGSLEMVAREGSQVVGAPAGVNYGEFNLSNPAINNDDQIAFRVLLTGAGVVANVNNRGIAWEGGGGGMELLVRSGEHAPGTPAGVLFGGIPSPPSTPLVFTSPVINDSGRVAFFGSLVGDVDSTNDRGVWATDGNGMLRLVVREGELLEVAPGDFRTISELFFGGLTGNSDGRSSLFSNSNQLVFRAVFTDGSEGIFVTSAVPEPSALLLLATALSGALMLSRSSRRA